MTRKRWTGTAVGLVLLGLLITGLGLLALISIVTTGSDSTIIQYVNRIAGGLAAKMTLLLPSS